MRRTFAAGFAGLFAGALLTGCTPATVDAAAAQEWAEQVRTNVTAQYDWVADISGPTSLQPNSGDDETFTFDEGQPEVVELVVGCFGAEGETATAGWTVRTDSNWHGGGSAEIVCDGSLVTIPSESGAYENVTAAMVYVTREGEPRQYYAALVGVAGS